MSLTTVKLNNHRISLPKFEQKTENWKGKDCLQVRYWIFGILGKRFSGKSTLVYSLIRKFLTKKMIFFFYTPTFYKDDTYKAIKELLDEKEIPYMVYSSIVDDSGIDTIRTFLDVHADDEEEESEPEEEQDEELSAKSVNFGKEKLKPKPKPKKKKKSNLTYFFVFDDMAREMRKPSFDALCKRSRHLKCLICISTQSPTDLERSVYQQLDYLAMFKNFNEESLIQLYERVQPNISLEQFQQLYNQVTEGTYTLSGKKLHNFLLLDRTDESFRKNLCEKISL